MHDLQSGPALLTPAQAVANLTHPDLSLRYYAAWWLGKFGRGEAGVVPALVAALEDEEDRTELGGYPLRRNAARALGRLGDRQAVPPLILCLDCPDFYVREAAAQSLGALGDSRAVPHLLPLLNGSQLVPGRPHPAQPVEAVMVALAALGVREAAPQMVLLLEHALPRVRRAAARSLYQLTQDPVYGEHLLQVLAQEPDLKARRTLLLDLGASGYLPAAEAIVAAAVENSFKFMALKSLLETHLQRHPDLSPEGVKVLGLMDRLL